MDIFKISEDWESDKVKFEALGKLVVSYMKTTIPEYEIMPEISYRTKDLLSIVKKIKKKQLQKKYDYSDIKDKLGIRIICVFQEEMQKIDAYLKNNFKIIKAEYKHDELDYNKLDYISNHYDLCLDGNNKAILNNEFYLDLIFEIQVRTLNQHAWSNAAHSLSYKQEAEISTKLKRKVYRLLSLYEIADDEFSSVNEVLINNPENLTYTLLRKLEGKIYKFAQVDFDRDTSVYYIKIILKYFDSKDLILLVNKIESFINENEVKIKRIFDENRVRFFEMTFLTQPEIFLIWYGIENHSFSINDNWSNDFDYSELEQIKTLWGKLIN